MDSPGGLGRATPPDWDHLDKHPMRPVLEGLVAPTTGTRDWPIPVAYDQGAKPYCFPAGTPVVMADGSERPIEEVRAGEQVISHTGKTRMVEAVMARRYTGPLTCLKVRGRRDPLRSTPEHPYLLRVDTLDRRTNRLEPTVTSWHAAGEWSALRGNRGRDRVSVHTWTGRPEDLVGEGEALDLLTVLPDAGFTDDHIRVYGTQKPVPRYVELTPAFGWLIGIYLAEGGAKERGSDLTFSLNREEVDFAETILKGLKEVFGLEGYLQFRPNNVLQVHANSNTAGLVLKALCGDRIDQKRLHPMIYRWPRSVLAAIWEGFSDGDGHHRFRPGKQGPSSEEGLTTVSSDLARGLWRLGLALDMAPTIRWYDRRPSHGVRSRRRAYVVSAYGESRQEVRPREGQFLICAIQSSWEEPYEGLVYNLEVEADHSYIADTVAVHNCPGYSSAQTMTAVTLAATGKVVVFDSDKIYAWANQHDGLAQPHDGSTVRAAFDCLTQIGASEFANGADTGPIDKLKSYVWTQSVDDVIKAVLTTGPVDLGINWYSAMNQIDGNGMIHLGGQLLGGHALVCRGVDTPNNRATLKNQWGNSWGKPADCPGDVFISLDDLATLLGQQGEACLAIWQ